MLFTQRKTCFFSKLSCFLRSLIFYWGLSWRWTFSWGHRWFFFRRWLCFKRLLSTVKILVIQFYKRNVVCTNVEQEQLLIENILCKSIWHRKNFSHKWKHRFRNTQIKRCHRSQYTQVIVLIFDFWHFTCFNHLWTSIIDGIILQILVEKSIGLSNQEHQLVENLAYNMFPIFLLSSLLLICLVSCSVFFFWIFPIRVHSKKSRPYAEAHMVECMSLMLLLIHTITPI